VNLPVAGSSPAGGAELDRQLRDPGLPFFDRGLAGRPSPSPLQVVPCEWGFNMGKSTIVSDPEVMMGKPVVAGTRITVEYILEELAHGQPMDTLVASHPTLAREGVLAALEYAAKVLRLDVVDPIEDP
jgi:uncharacterized protein (DUF433 family)